MRSAVASLVISMMLIVTMSACASDSTQSAARVAIERIYVFGDSFSDIGAGYVDGNGPTAVAYLAQELGLHMTHPAAPDATPSSSLNFAVSGGRSDDDAGRQIKGHWIGVGLRRQARQFARAVEVGSVEFDAHTAVAFIAIGLNDTSLTPQETATNLRQAVAQLHASGLRKFVIARLPVAFAGNPAVARRLNPMLIELPQRLAQEYPAARFFPSAWGHYYDEVFTSPARFGFTDTHTPCAPGRALLDEDPSACPHPRRHFFYHPEHPSTAAHRAVGRLLAAEARRWPGPAVQR